MIAADIIRSLQTDTGWISQAALLFRPNRFNRPYETVQARFYSEVTVRVPTQKRSKRFGQLYPALQRRRMDMVALVQPNYRAYIPAVAGVEVKIGIYDLLNDDKLVEYLPYCHFFYLAIPDYEDQEMKVEALAKIESVVPAAGLLLVDPVRTRPGRVIVQRRPQLQQPADQHLKEIYAELLIKQFRTDEMEIDDEE